MALCLTRLLFIHVVRHRDTRGLKEISDPFDDGGGRDDMNRRNGIRTTNRRPSGLV